jgi:hypothetical protein
MWCALLEEAMRPLLYKYVSSSSHLLVGALEESICKLAIVILFLFWNNKSQDFGGQIGGLAKCVDAILTR